MNVLIIKNRNIGDVVLATPMAEALKNQGVKKVDFLVRSGTEAFLTLCQKIDSVYLIPARNDSFLRYLWSHIMLIRKLRKTKYFLTINTTDGDHGLIIAKFIRTQDIRHEVNGTYSNLLQRLIVTNPIKGPSKRSHTVLRNINYLPGANNLALINTKICLPNTLVLRTKQKLTRLGWDQKKRTIHIHPTSRWLFKCWKDSYVAEIIDELYSKNIQVIITSSTDEKELNKVAEIKRLSRSSFVNLAGRVSIEETAAISLISGVFFGVDSAPMHIASAAGAIVIALFGPSHPIRWGPWPASYQENLNPYAEINGIQTCKKNVIIQKSWPCVPCMRDGCEGSKKSACLDSVKPQDVIPFIKSALVHDN